MRTPAEYKLRKQLSLSMRNCMHLITSLTIKQLYNKEPELISTGQRDERNIKNGRNLLTELNAIQIEQEQLTDCRLVPGSKLI